MKYYVYFSSILQQSISSASKNAKIKGSTVLLSTMILVQICPQILSDPEDEQTQIMHKQ